jgi:signal transduction histidine kinase
VAAPEQHNTISSYGNDSSLPYAILIVDDEQINLELTSTIFRNRGYRVFTALNAEDALVIVKRDQPEIVLLDYMMPGRDGFAALRDIKQDYSDTYVIILTGRGSEQVAVELMKAGASDYILKPFLNQDLVERVERVLRLRGIELKNRELLVERDRLLGEIESWNRELETRVHEKTLELRRYQEELIQTEKLSTLGYISAGMAHEIRNPLNAIALYVQLVKGGLEDQEKQEFLDKIESEVRRIDSILRKLLDTVKRPRYSLSEISLVAVIDASLQILQPLLHMHNIQVQREYRQIPPQIQADPAEIEQIFTNLFVNAIEEMHGGGILGIMLDVVDSMILIRVSDTGKGVPQENLQRIFDPFFTTKSSGTGLGLSVVLRIVRSYHGKIDVTSGEATGTTFLISLPVTA